MMDEEAGSLLQAYVRLRGSAVTLAAPTSRNADENFLRCGQFSCRQVTSRRRRRK